VNAAARQSGLVLVYVSVLGLLMMLIWTLAWNATHETIHVEAVHELRAARDEGVTRVAAYGLGLLETGIPEQDPYECLVTITNGSGTFVGTLQFSSVVWPDTWTVSAWKATESELLMLPEAPASF